MTSNDVSTNNKYSLSDEIAHIFIYNTNYSTPCLFLFFSLSIISSRFKLQHLIENNRRMRTRAIQIRLNEMSFFKWLHCIRIALIGRNCIRCDLIGGVSYCYCNCYCYRSKRTVHSFKEKHLMSVTFNWGIKERLWFRNLFGTKIVRYW